MNTQEAIELAPENIRVNAVAPGIIKTPMHGQADDAYDKLDGLHPLGHVGEVKDVVDAVIYLADANFVTPAAAIPSAPMTVTTQRRTVLAFCAVFRSLSDTHPPSVRGMRVV